LAGEAVEFGFGVFDVEECCVCAAVGFGGGVGVRAWVTARSALASAISAAAISWVCFSIWARS